MTAYVEECRQEWRRLGVPDLLADEMAAELESDLAEAEADGVSAAEMLGESDPRRFAATWARERGLVAEAAPKKKRRRWIWVAVGLALAFVFMAVMGLFAAVGVSSHVHASPPQQPQTVQVVALPNFVGLRACKAVRKAIRTGFDVRIPGHEHGYSCGAVVHAENSNVKGSHRTVTLWLRRARR
jgi:hypothetical protein